MWRRFTPIACLLLGLGVMAWALMAIAGNALPFPDPTPELLARQAAVSTRAMVLLLVGLVVALGGVGGLWWRRRRSR
mgnify:CR=1 FL=1